MGCVLSSIDEDEKVRICKERKRLIKQLVDIRGEFSDSLLAYLKALRNTGATLRQLTESDSLELETSSNGLAGPPSSPPPLPLSPPPPPPPPLIRDKPTVNVSQAEILESDENNTHTQSISPILSMICDYCFTPTGQFSATHQNYETIEPVEEEKWEETKTEFEEEDPEAEVVSSLSGKQQSIESVYDNSSAMSLCTKDITDMHMVVGRSERTLEGIIKELDDYFLKASAGVKEITVLIDINRGDILQRQNSGHHNRKRCNSAKVFSVLSWSWYSKSPHFTRDAAELTGPSEPCRPGAHCATLKKLHASEKKLYKEVKEEGITALELERKSLLLHKQEDENLDWIKIDKTRSSVENLESDRTRLQQSISQTTSSILELIEEELFPQLVAVTSGLTQMWRTMHECHQAQTLISQQLNQLSDNQNAIPNAEYHHQATIQLETEASYWYDSFCKLVKSQREYVRTLCKWIQLTNCRTDDHEASDRSSMICTICAQWELGLEQLPDKAVSDAIKSLLSSIRSIIDQQALEDNILKKWGKLDRRLQKGLNSLDEMKKRTEWNFEDEDLPVNMSPRHPLSIKLTKIEALKTQVESEKANYLDSVQCSRAMILNNLKNTLPHVFQSLMEFSSASAQAIEVIHGQVKPVDSSEIASQN